MEDIEDLISIISSKKPIIKEVDNYFFVLYKRKDFITELHKKQYAKMEKYLKGIYPLSNSDDDKNNVDTVRLTCNSNLGINIEIDNKSKKLWNWIESLIAPISYTMYHEFQQSRELNGWRKWWCEEQSEIYHFMAQDNFFFYMVIEPYLIQSWNDINKENIKFHNYMLMPMRTIFNGKYAGPFPTGEMLLEKYDVEALRYSIASMGNKISSFNPEKLVDESLKRDNIDFKYNAIIRKIKRLQSMAEKQMKDIPQTISVKQIACYGIGVALFVAIGCTLPISIPNTTAHIDLGYMVMAVFAYLFGPVAGVLVGGLGRFLEDMILFGSIGSPGWLIASICMGFFIGLTFSRTKKMHNKKLALVIQIVCIIIINAVFLIGLAPFVSSLWHSVPYVTKMPSGISAFVSNCIAIIVLGIPLSKALERILKNELKANKK